MDGNKQVDEDDLAMYYLHRVILYINIFMRKNVHKICVYIFFHLNLGRYCSLVTMKKNAHFDTDK